MTNENTEERRRYFRINDTVKLSYCIVHPPGATQTDDSYDLMTEQNKRIDMLIEHQKNNHPEIVELIALLNQKIERLCQIDTSSHTTLAHYARNVNISACGLAFTEHYCAAVGTQLQLFLVLDDHKKLELEGLVIDCKMTSNTREIASHTLPSNTANNTQANSDNKHYEWRVDFLHLSPSNQELLIQHIVRRQSTLLAEKRH
ncbi:hypothetical protein [Marinagarivorans algicola]|uniref:hypothetical protein n=1 Tax=Marinagarivorans algicola TaxID=1513270 RepID=UPI0006B4F112|nr:hypothetical protein [Marinagarivorans algicola]